MPAAHSVSTCNLPTWRSSQAERLAPYSFVLRVRPDHLFMKPLMLPRLVSALGPDLPGGGANVLLSDDRMAFAWRSDAAVVLLSPSVAYRQCATALQWAAACRVGEGRARQLMREGRPPCCPMTLVTVPSVVATARNTSWRPMHPLLSDPLCTWTLKRSLDVNRRNASGFLKTEINCAKRRQNEMRREKLTLLQRSPGP